VGTRGLVRNQDPHCPGKKEEGQRLSQSRVLRLQLPRAFSSEGHSVVGMSRGRWSSEGPGTAAACKDLTALLRNCWCGWGSPGKGWGGGGCRHTGGPAHRVGDEIQLCHGSLCWYFTGIYSLFPRHLCTSLTVSQR